MNQLEIYLNDFKVKRGISRDDHAAELLGLTVSEYSRGKRKGYFTDDTCIKIAREINVHPALIILSREKIKEKNQRMSGVWNDALSAARQYLSTDNKDYRK